MTVTRPARDVLDEPAPDVDVVTAGDVFYSRDLVDTHARVPAPAPPHRGATVLVGDPGRAYARTRTCGAVAAYDIPTTHDLESTETKLSTSGKCNDKIARNGRHGRIRG